MLHPLIYELSSERKNVVLTMIQRQVEARELNF